LAAVKLDLDRRQPRPRPRPRIISAATPMKLRYRIYFHSITQPLHAITMSTAAKTTLATTALGIISIILFVHFQQTADKAVLLPPSGHHNPS